jgi:hypothetical protein
MVGNVWLQLLGRHGVFSAVIEPDRNDALIGAIVLEELDLLVDCTTQSLHPRESGSILTEIESMQTGVTPKLLTLQSQTGMELVDEEAVSRSNRRHARHLLRHGRQREQATLPPSG